MKVNVSLMILVYHLFWGLVSIFGVQALLDLKYSRALNQFYTVL